MTYTDNTVKIYQNMYLQNCIFTKGYKNTTANKCVNKNKTKISVRTRSVNKIERQWLFKTMFALLLMV